MTEKRFTLDFDDPRAVWIDDNIKDKSYTVINDTLKEKNIQEIVECLNALHEENKNTKAILNDFMSILNRLQANPTDKKLLGIARDMLQNMGVDLE